jgi:hypothetical protein
MVAALVVMGLVSLGGFASARSARTSAASAAEPTGLTWTLVNSKCSSSQQPAGRACWDKSGGSSWDVHEGSATWTQPTYNAHFTYSVPEEIPASGGSVNLALTANDVSNNSGLSEQVCVQSPFKLSVNSGSDPCAHAFARTPGSSDSGSKNLTLLPSGVTPAGLCPNSGPGSPPECVTLTIELENGGNLYFTYRASPAPKISYSFDSGFHSSSHSSSSTAEITGEGSFQLTEQLNSNGCANGTNDHGSALVRIHRPHHGSYTIHLQSFAASYCAPEPGIRSVGITYRVTKSTASCLPVGDHVLILAYEKTPKNLTVGHFCGLRASRHPAVKITST